VRAGRVRNAKDLACREPVAGFAMTVAGMTAMTVTPSPRDDSVAGSGNTIARKSQPEQAFIYRSMFETTDGRM
jgi:hypothetical protein